MAYFHPWTLRKTDGDAHVPYAGSLRPPEQTWQSAMQVWLDGRILSEEAKRYIGNFLSVHRVRPQDDMDSDLGNSDGFFSDQELHVSHETLQEAMQTRIGGRRRKNRDDADDDAVAGASHYHNSQAAVSLADQVWQCEVVGAAMATLAVST